MKTTTLNLIKESLEKFSNTIINPETQEEHYKEVYDKLALQFPTFDTYQLQYWTAKILFLSEWDTNFQLSFEGDLEEPSSFTLKIACSYGC